jgi:hypothetical protein
LEWRNLV